MTKQSGYGLPLETDEAQRRLDEACRFATPFNIKSLRALARRADRRAEEYNGTLGRTEPEVDEVRWVLWAAARNAQRRLRIALRNAAA